MSALNTHILTPDGAVFEGEIVSIHVPGSEGQFQVLNNHADLISSLTVGVARVADADRSEQQFAISGGFVEVKDNKVTVLAEAAERPEEIDVDRAEAAKKRAKKRMSDSKMDRTRAEAALKRAINRLKLAGNY